MGAGCRDQAAFLVLYPLSLGPAEWAVDHDYMWNQTLFKIYWPIWWLRSKYPPLADAVFWYGGFWTNRVIEFPDPADSGHFRGIHYNVP